MVLTAHPLQRIGAFALAAIQAEEPVDAPHPADLTPVGFDRAVELMIEDACLAADYGRRGKDSFWLKSSGAFFPNSKMNHRPTLGKRPRAENDERIRAWRTMPEPADWPAAPCVLCGRNAVGFYGKVDVPLVDAAGYCNSTPRGHGGLALCWPCVCCFHALPYGARLTGGPSTAVHSWDEEFLAWATLEQADTTCREITGEKKPDPSGRYQHERTALLAIRRYEQPMRAGVELMVFSNDNRGPSLGMYGLEEPLAEWLRSTLREPVFRRAWRSLIAAYEVPPVQGNRRLARDAFHRPLRIFLTAADRLAGGRGLRAVTRFDRPLADLTLSFLREVMDVNQADVDQVERLAREVAAEISQEDSAGALMGFRVACRSVVALQKWLEKKAVLRALRPSSTARRDPLLNTAQFRLLFDPDGQGWLYRRLLLIAVLGALHELGWTPQDADDELAEIEAEKIDDVPLAAEDEAFLGGVSE
ncbi:hypothetical protein [Parafrankia sp. EUN1f]|uniref:hypothetical protein n=1 Tax=Parafrankia sp. EUN1f TaxID=102897 RepID=UPI0012F79F1F|nr:hypothetical protein [Parafrankia sp. EUN1f]